MKKLLFILLLLPLFAFPQSEKPYRSIIIDSVKALNGGRIDVKDTLLLDSLAVYNSDLSSQYTSRSLVDSAFVGTAMSGNNTIYSADDNLAGNRIVAMGANSLTFSGNLTTFSGINATSANFVVDITDNVGTKLFLVRNDGSIGAGTLPTTTRFTIRGSGNNNTTITANFENVSGSDLFTIKDGGDMLIAPIPSAGAISMGDPAVTIYRLTIRSIFNLASALQLYRSLNTNGAGVIHAFAMNDANDTKTEVAYTVGTMIDNTAGVVKGALAFWTRNGASISEKVRIDNLGNMGIGTTTPAISAKLEISSTTGAVLFPRMTTAQRDALTAVDGMVIYNNSLDKLQVRAAGAWISLH